jgi:hypothetical protein
MVANDSALRRMGGAAANAVDCTTIMEQRQRGSDREPRGDLLMMAAVSLVRAQHLLRGGAK